MKNKISKTNIDSIVAGKWFKGKVIRGSGRGKTLGFPTINLQALATYYSLLTTRYCYGVYLCQVKINQQIYQGLLHYGPRPTFNKKDPSLEIYVLAFNQKLQEGKIIYFKLLKYLRKIKKFKTKNALVNQIRKDLTSLTRA